jgi:hypothetical protein
MGWKTIARREETQVEVVGKTKTIAIAGSKVHRNRWLFRREVGTKASIKAWIKALVKASINARVRTKHKVSRGTITHC